MKSRIYLFGLVLSLLFSLGSCKSKESAYKAAYEAAKEKEMEENIEEVTPVEKTKPTSNTNVQKEKVTAVDGAGIQRYNVVIGSFTNKTNAVSLKERMERQGYNAFLAQNERGMYRVIVATFNDRTDAVSERESLKDKYYPDFQDAWLLEQQY